MRGIIKDITEFIRFTIFAKRSNFTFKEKLEILRVQCSNHLRNKFSKGDREITQKLFGFTISAYSYHTLQCLIREIFLLKDYHCDFSHPTPKIIDCGANIGIAVLYFKKRFPECHITAFEPNPNAFRLLEKNVRQNNLKNVTLHNIGVSDTAGTVDFFMSENKGTLLGSLLKERGGSNQITVDAQPLSSFLASPVDLIKMDIEGAETAVIQELAASSTIQNSTQFIIEYHHKIKGEPSKLSQSLKHFEDNGFEYNIRTNYVKLGGFQDVLLHIYK